MKSESLPANHGDASPQFGIPVVSETDGDEVLIAARELFRVISEYRALAKAFALVHVDLASTAHFEDGHLMFVTPKIAGAAPAKDQQDNLAPAPFRVRQLLKAVEQWQSPADGDADPAVTVRVPDTAAEPQSSNDIDIASAVRWVSIGPRTIRIDGNQMPWATVCAPPDPQVDGGVRSTQITLEQVGQEDHLVDVGRARLRSEQNAEIAEIVPGSLVLAESCRSETLLMADPEALILQLPLDLGNADEADNA